MPLARCADGSLLDDTLTLAQAQLCELLAMRRRQLDVLEASPDLHVEQLRRTPSVPPRSGTCSCGGRVISDAGAPIRWYQCQGCGHQWMRGGST